MNLLNDRPVHRNTDPVTSRKADEHVTRSGIRKRQRDEVVVAVINNPGLTSRELAEAMGMDRHMVARRLPEMEPAYVERGQARVCESSGREAMTWIPTAYAKEVYRERAAMAKRQRRSPPVSDLEAMARLQRAYLEANERAQKLEREVARLQTRLDAQGQHA